MGRLSDVLWTIAGRPVWRAFDAALFRFPWWGILKREVHAYFVSPMAYVIMSTWLIWCGLTYWMLASYYAQQPFGGGAQDSPLTAFFGGTTLFYVPLLVYVPLLTMRLLAEERSRGTIEVLMTAPVRDWEVVVGKYLAAVVFWIVLWLPSLLYVWLTSRYGHIDLGVVASAYLGIFGIGAYYLAIGVLMSAVAKNQIVAAVLTFFTLGGLFVLGLGQYVFGDENRELFAYVSIWGHMESFSRGVIDSRYLVFDTSLAVLAIALAIGVLHARRVEG